MMIHHRKTEYEYTLKNQPRFNVERLFAITCTLRLWRWLHVSTTDSGRKAARDASNNLVSSISCSSLDEAIIGIGI